MRPPAERRDEGPDLLLSFIILDHVLHVVRVEK